MTRAHSNSSLECNAPASRTITVKLRQHDDVSEATQHVNKPCGSSPAMAPLSLSTTNSPSSSVNNSPVLPRNTITLRTHSKQHVDTPRFPAQSYGNTINNSIHSSPVSSSSSCSSSPSLTSTSLSASPLCNSRRRSSGAHYVLSMEAIEEMEKLKHQEKTKQQDKHRQQQHDDTNNKADHDDASLSNDDDDADADDALDFSHSKHDVRCDSSSIRKRASLTLRHAIMMQYSHTAMSRSNSNSNSHSHSPFPSPCPSHASCTPSTLQSLSRASSLSELRSNTTKLPPINSKELSELAQVQVFDSEHSSLVVPTPDSRSCMLDLNQLDVLGVRSTALAPLSHNSDHASPPRSAATSPALSASSAPPPSSSSSFTVSPSLKSRSLDSLIQQMEQQQHLNKSHAAADDESYNQRMIKSLKHISVSRKSMTINKLI